MSLKPAATQSAGYVSNQEQETGEPLEASFLRQSSPGGSKAVMILDGGMGHQLKAMGIEVTGEVGTMRRFLGVAMANLEQPDMVRDAHLAYIDAGAEVITTNTYSCVPKCMQYAPDDKADLSLERIIAAAGQIARDACELRPERNVKVAGALPPLAESYRPDLVGPFEENLEQYKLIARSIAPFADVLLCETMSTADEARAAVTAAATTGLPVWVSWTLDEVTPVLRSGESIAEAFEAVKNVEGANLQGCLFNCTSPEVINQAMPVLRDLAPTLRIGAYANGFLTATGGTGEYRDLDACEYCDEFASTWMSCGASIIGGCCGIFPHHIKHLSQNLRTDYGRL